MSAGDPPTFRDLFPSLADRVPPNALEAIDRPFLPHSFGAGVLLMGTSRVAQQQAWVRGLVPLEKLSLTLLKELRAAAECFEDERLVFELARFGVCAYVAGAVHLVGDLPRTHEWLLRAVVDEYTGDREYEFELAHLFLWDSVSASVIQQSAADAVLQWLTTVFAHSERSGDHVELAAEAFDVLDGLLSAGVTAAASSGMYALDALMFRANWAVSFASERVDAATAVLVGMLDKDFLTDEERACLESFVATFSKQLTETPQSELAAEVLQRYAHLLDPTVRFALRAASCDANAERLAATQEELLDDLAAVREELEREAASPTERLLRRGQSFKRIEGVLKAYAEAGFVRPAVELLAAWSSDPQDGVLLSDATLALPTHPVGTLWCVEGASAPNTAIVASPNAQLTSALNAFLGTTILAREAPSTLQQGERPLHPNEHAAASFERSALVHLRLNAWMDLGRDRLTRNLVLAPGVPIPIQPLLLRELGTPTALCIGLRKPALARPVRTVALIGDNSITSPIEVEALEAGFRNAEAKVVHLDATAEAFRDAYADEQYDVIWVAAHGEHEGLRLEESALVLGDDERLSLDDLASLPAPTGDRRALVLNVCSGGLSAVLGGLLGIGLGPALAGPSQTVVSHLWPVFPQYAAAFGVLFADSLLRCADHLDAYAATMKVLLRGREPVESALAGLPAAGDVRERFMNAGHNYESVVAWGAPVLLV